MFWRNVRWSQKWKVPFRSEMTLECSTQNKGPLKSLSYNSLQHCFDLFLVAALSSGKSSKKRPAVLHWCRSDKLESSNVKAWGLERWWADLNTPFSSEVIFANLKWSNVVRFSWEVDLWDALCLKGASWTMKISKQALACCILGLLTVVSAFEGKVQS